MDITYKYYETNCLISCFSPHNTEPDGPEGFTENLFLKPPMAQREL